MGEESLKPASSTPTGAVFLSYASQDAEPARKICDALRAAGIEVWFDQSELRGGDAWDQKIRQQIHDCVLFIPVISANTASRHEGYFRLEWDLADQRTHMIARNRAFIVPVCVDATPESSADAPESFQRVHWTRLPGGNSAPAFVERLLKLLSPAKPDEPSKTVPSASSVAGAPSPNRHWLWNAVLPAAAAALVLVVGYLVLDRLGRSKAAAQVANSIAVLPLANESGDASQQYFSDGISEDLITALSQFPGLKVIGRTSAFQFRESKEDSRSIGSKLGVAHLLEGSVRKYGDMIRVSAELIDTNDGSTQWTERYDRPYKDLFALQDEITSAVAEALRAKLLPGEHGAVQSERPPGGSLEAYNALLQGRFYLSRHTESDARNALVSYKRATELDPRYAVAWSALSQAWTEIGTNYRQYVSMEEAYAKAREAADRALALSPDLASAHVARGFLVQNADFNWRVAEAEFRRAMELAPNDAEAKFYLGNQLATFGQVETAIDLTRQALAIEPLRANWYAWLASYFSGLNRLDEAERAIRRAIELQPGENGDYWNLAIIEVQRGNAQAALAAAYKEIPGFYQDSALAYARQIGSERTAADDALATLIEKHATRGLYWIADVYALRNDANNTFAWLDRAWSERDSAISYLLFDPFILRYRDDPRFAAFCKKVGLPTPAEVGKRT
jgi:TolB-like protein/Tfp pilus assembly protein PilF